VSDIARLRQAAGDPVLGVGMTLPASGTTDDSPPFQRWEVRKKAECPGQGINERAGTETCAAPGARTRIVCLTTAKTGGFHISRPRRWSPSDPNLRMISFSA
jgi:hypothetical protein